MRLPIRRIGNSQGIILPQVLIAQCSFQDEVEVKVEGDSLVITKKLSQNDEQASLRYQSNAQANWRSAR